MPWMLGHYSNIQQYDDGSFKAYCFLCRGWWQHSVTEDEAKKAAAHHLLTGVWPELKEKV